MSLVSVFVVVVVVVVVFVGETATAVAEEEEDVMEENKIPPPNSSLCGFCGITVCGRGAGGGGTVSGFCCNRGWFGGCAEVCGLSSSSSRLSAPSK